MAAGLSAAENTAQASQGPGRTAEPAEISKTRQIWAQDGNKPRQALFAWKLVYVIIYYWSILQFDLLE